MAFATPAWDMALLELINRQARNPLFDFIMPVLSDQKLMWAAGVIAFLWLFRKGGMKKALPVLLVLVAVGLADFSSGLLKKNFGRVRPLNAHAGIWLHEDGQWQQRPADFVQEKERGKSYVSAHAANTMAAAVMVMLFWPKLRPWMFLLPFLVGYSRVYLGKHYPSDVMAGWLVGLTAASLTAMLIVALRDRRARRLKE